MCAPDLYTSISLLDLTRPRTLLFALKRAEFVSKMFYSHIFPHSQSASKEMVRSLALDILTLEVWVT